MNLYICRRKKKRKRLRAPQNLPQYLTSRDSLVAPSRIMSHRNKQRRRCFLTSSKSWTTLRREPRGWCSRRVTRNSLDWEPGITATSTRAKSSTWQLLTTCRPTIARRAVSVPASPFANRPNRKPSQWPSQSSTGSALAISLKTAFSAEISLK